MTENDYVKQYAIRLPNGKLHAHHPGSYRISDGVIVYIEDDEAVPEPVVYESLPEVQKAIERFQDTAAHMGITEWLGRIETRTCTPFTDSSADDGDSMVSDLEKFLGEQP